MHAERGLAQRGLAQRHETAALPTGWPGRPCRPREPCRRGDRRARWSGHASDADVDAAAVVVVVGVGGRRRLGLSSRVG